MASEMAKKAQQKAQDELPKLGCDICANQAPGVVGYVIAQKPGQPRILEKCKCRIEREKAKKGLVSA